MSIESHRSVQLAALLGSIIALLPSPAQARLRDVISELREAKEEASEEGGRCRKAGRKLSSVIEDLRDAEGRRALKRALRDLEDIQITIEDECPRSVAKSVKRAKRDLEDEVEDAREDREDREDKEPEEPPEPQEQCTSFNPGKMSGFQLFGADERPGRGWRLSWPNGKKMRNYDRSFSLGGQLYYPDGKVMLSHTLKTFDVRWPNGRRAVVERSKKQKKRRGYFVWADPSDPWLSVETKSKNSRTKVSVNVNNGAVNIFECITP